MTVTPTETFASETEWDSNNLTKKQLNVTENINAIMDANSLRIATGYSYEHETVGKNAIGFLILHILGLSGLAITEGIILKTFAWRK